jgi:hypothetical protein
LWANRSVSLTLFVAGAEPSPRGPLVGRDWLTDAPALRRERAAEGSAFVSRLAQRWSLAGAEPRLLFDVQRVVEPTVCAACGRGLRSGRYLERAADRGSAVQRCLPCGRRALVEWADRRRAEVSAARELASTLSTREPEPADQPRGLVS